MNTLLLFLSGLSVISDPATGDSLQKQIGLHAYAGFIIPHAPDLKAVSQSQPVGIELTYSRVSFSRAAYERCNCFARTGAYINYITFNNPAELGRTIGIGGYFEPLIRYRSPLYFSLRATAGLAYLTRVYDAATNPRNTFFGSPLSGMLALSASAHHRLTRHIHASATVSYNHISNGGIRQPNRGMNFPTLGLGLLYLTGTASLPDAAQWPKSTISNRFIRRIMGFGSVRTLPQTDKLPETAGWIWGLSATAGYRVNRFHALSAGLEFVDDGYIREQLNRDSQLLNHRQLGLLMGYELWLGRYVFTTHMGWNLLQPTALPDGRLFQRYQLLFTVRNRYLAGVGLRARLNVAEGFDLRMGVQF